MKRIVVTITVIVALLTGCKDPVKNPPNNKPAKPVELKYDMQFNADSAYAYVLKQVEFGPRVPGSMAHGIAANYLHKTLGRFCDTAFIQLGEKEDADGKTIQIKNIIGSFKPELKERVLLCSHWDTRPQADEDKEKPNTPADGANDGASGVGVLLEAARQLSLQKPNVGIDIILFDAEDMGKRFGPQNSWCLGSQYWAENLHQPNYTARFGILLDMVGAKDAVFAYEGNSLNFAPHVVNKVWKNAIGLGFSKYFIPYKGGTVTDDHYFINKIAGIPCIDIIHYDVTSANGFGEFWHTHGDNISVIDKGTLNAVGRTVLKTVWEE